MSNPLLHGKILQDRKVILLASDHSVLELIYLIPNLQGSLVSFMYQ